MKYKIDIVSGLNYGDECKGLVTNALSDKDTLIIFASNSAQRSHTVVNGDERHAFRCFGSGTFKGAATYYSNGYMPNPSLFREEWNDLQKIGITPRVFINSDCLWVTPMDMYYNMMMSRGKTNTTGCGAWATICRNAEIGLMSPPYNGTINKNRNEDVLKKNLGLIKQYYYIRTYEDIDTWFFNGEYLISNIIDDFYFMLNHCTIIENTLEAVTDFLHSYSHIIFENSQGLLLDADYSADIEHSTPASVGCKVPVSLIKKYFKEEDDIDLNAYYVTRSYLTRHGDGPMVGIECPSTVIHPEIIDRTNIFNNFQGSIRYGYFTENVIEDMKRRLNNDFSWCRSVTETAKANIVITHTNILRVDSRWNTIVRDSKIKTFVSNNEIDFDIIF